MLGCERIATGHYGRCARSDGRTQLLRAADRAKDQTYFLWGIDREVLDRLELPLGELSKTEVRGRARALGLATADKPESFDICFVPDDDYAGFLATRLDAEHPAFQPGPILTVDGNEVGRHNGYCRYTIGQRKGLPGGFPAPMHVVRIEPATRSVIIGPASALESTRITVAGVNWLGDPPTAGDAVGVQIRHRGSEAPGTIHETDDGHLAIRLDEPHTAVTPGQSAAIYEGEMLLGGGRILESCQ